MKLTEQQLFDYIYCPAKFDMKYIKNIDLKDPVTMSNMLKIVSKYFYANLLNGKICTVNDLKAKWDSVCKANASYFENNKKVLEGMGLIINMINWASRNEIVLLDIDTKYNIVIDDIEFEGNMNPILASNNNKTEILISDFSSKMPDQIVIDMNLKNTIDAYAYKTLFNKDIDCIRVHNMKNNTDFITMRNKDDYNRLVSTIKGVAAGIKNNVYYPREQILCTSCNARQYCKYWNK